MRRMSGGSTSAQPGTPPVAPAEEKKGKPDRHEQELVALLHKMVRERGRVGAAEELEVDSRTLAACLKRNVLSRRVRRALERELAADPGREEEAAGQEERVALLERELASLRTSVVAGFQALRDGQLQKVAQAKRELPRAGLAREGGSQVEEAGLDGEPVVGGPSPGDRPQQGKDAPGKGEEAISVWKPPRQYPDLVTREAATDDEQVYGTAWPLVEEWRRLWEAHERPGKGVTWLGREVRILELEVALLEEHELTLPPATYPQRGLERDTHLNWRLQALANRRRRAGVGRSAALDTTWGRVRPPAGGLLLDTADLSFVRDARGSTWTVVSCPSSHIAVRDRGSGPRSGESSQEGRAGLVASPGPATSPQAARRGREGAGRD